MGKFDRNFIQYSDKKVKDEKNHLAFFLTTHIIFYIFLIFFAIFFIWYTVFISTHSFYGVFGVSMMPTLNSQIPSDQMERGDDLREATFDAVYVDKMTSAKLFDVVVIETEETDPKTHKPKNIVKRFVAAEGDYVTIAKAVDKLGEQHFYFFRIPAGSNFETFSDEAAMMEENGENGYEIYKRANWDASKNETVKTAEGVSHSYETIFYNTFLKGYFEQSGTYQYHVSAQGLVYVQVPQGKFFYLGDNRGHSDDARKNGFMSIDAIVGRTEFIVYNYNFGNRLWEVIKFYFSEMDKFFAR